MARVIVLYGKKLDKITINDKELDIDPISNKSIPDWFEPSGGRDGWRGLLKEVRAVMADDQEDLFFEFLGPKEFCAVFDENLQKNGEKTTASGISDDEIAQDRFQDALKAEHRGNYKIALKYYEVAANAGHAEAQFKVGDYYFKGLGLDGDRDVETDKYRAVEFYEKAAKQGLKEAQYCLGNCFLKGEGVAKDEGEGVKWIEKAANQGYVDAQYIMGNCCRDGCGIEMNPHMAAAWYRSAANQGSAEGQYNLGKLYLDGNGVEESQEKAFDLFRRASHQDHVIAHYNLGNCYAKGIGVTRNESTALNCYQRAAEKVMLLH